ncbi:tRNA (adenosine(37)-N6)-threonylcarbamoyltransferase complex ATPase subunit type 1 TsaE [Pseudodesulfovibrio sp. zrk46]|uniref:tRNA (adenosine(37)-N6)-threonylcarbamoyltransferase complex ATPase subunit type 1 TsaE n=1 Tax=Pseudodesulfovibrio sp. zrk46 TaxID=2725288 RepID=UPI001449D297|nr:tRNA (adenosine(37)-N6)-threonylcarbamoyltransferase complex ATPase subunit type 1 TsaE [Pseudodesulfovibrio sp. zrk46]QJB57818.1 tRNA (adenosine(37)-N6)-threonylcarbamoyltransferase complex ATPase subunit type 1 TsaE [Pseudodesulfovibrio sp. zrk46]
MDVQLHLEDTDATLVLGRFLANALAGIPNPPALLLQGDLGSGKTTLVRGLVESLPGAAQAEVSSPSFNIFNLYPTTPPVAHFDLYRLEGMPPDDELFELFEDRATLAVVEWIQFLDREYWPEESIFLEWTSSETGRTLTFHAMGRVALEIANTLPEQFKLKQ